MTEETLFELARKTPETERPALLDRACEGQLELRARVEALLRADAGSSPLSKPSPIQEATTGFQGTVSYASPDPAPGILIASRYTLEQKLGEGGMGEVWVAKQSEPVKRKVALKLIKPGMDSKSVLQRFEQERQALAMMDHPNIAKVLDGGLTHDRRPFFVMELVNGLPLTKFCDEAKLGIKERLELFVPICQAVQHAHQKGIVHRDLKPGNILVTMIDGKPVPKVIDFGVAKATGGKLTDESMSTQFGAVIGTLEYMSPEQAGFSNQDVDTRSDIYSLGVILYELLTGLRPFDSKRLKQAALDEVIRIIREEEPSKPSTKLSTDESLPSLAAVRHIEPGKLTALLRGELDWVVMKCLEKQRDRRYETANGLAADVLRYLAGEPVQAHPPSAGYRLRKFVHRNRLQVIAASLVLVALLAGITGTTVGLFEAMKQERIAEKKAEGERLAKLQAEAKQAEAEEQRRRAEAGEKLAGERLVQVEAEKVKVEAERKKADEEKQIAQAVKDFLQRKLLAQAETSVQADQLLRSGGRVADAKLNPTVRELLDRAAKGLAPDAIEVSFPNQPRVQAEILHTVGDAYYGIGETAKGIDFLTRAAELSRQHNGPGHRHTLATLNNLAGAYRDAGNLPKAIELFEQVRQVFEKQPDTDQTVVLSTLHNLAVAYQDAGNLKRAIELLEQVRDARLQTLGVNHPQSLTTLNNLAVAYREAGDLPRAIKMFERVVAVQIETQGAEHTDTLLSRFNLAVCYKDAGKPNAITLLEEARDAFVKKLGPTHRASLGVLRELANAYRDAGRPNGIELLEQARDGQVKHLGAEHPDTLITLNNLASAYEDTGKLPEAIELFERVRAARTRTLGAEHPATLVTSNNLALAYSRSGELAKAIELFERVRKLEEKVIGADHPNTVTTLYNLAMAYRKARKLPQAIELFERVRDVEIKTLGPDHSSTLGTLNALSKSYIESGQGGKAVPPLKMFVAGQRKRVPKEDVGFANLLSDISLYLLNADQYAAAEEMLRESLAIREKKEADAWTTFNTQSMLGMALLGQKKYADAEPLLLKGYQGLKEREKTIPQARGGEFRIPEALSRLVALYTATNKPEEVKKFQELRDKYPKTGAKQ